MPSGIHPTALIEPGARLLAVQRDHFRFHSFGIDGNEDRRMAETPDPGAKGFKQFAEEASRYRRVLVNAD